MNTATRAQLLAQTLSDIATENSPSADQLLELLSTELGHPQILDSPQTQGDLRCQAIAPRHILHIIAGNTPMAGIQSLTRGLLLGSHNYIKLPSAGLPELSRFIDALPPALQNLVESSTELPDPWLRNSQSLIVFGSDDTIQHFRQQVRADQTFLAHGHRLSFGILFSDPDHHAAQLAARDVSLFDQQGCLSPHVFYINENQPNTALTFAAQLAEEMQRFNQHSPRRTLSTEEIADITALRDVYDYRQVNDPSVKIWCSQDSTDWTVIYEQDPQFAVSPLNRVIFVKPLPLLDQLPQALFLVRPHLSSIAIHPFEKQHFEAIQALGASRICPLGKSQQPSLFWHQDGQAQLAPLVKWIDFG
ncbi:MAG: hypothetical protein L3J39_19240 [Verrucomicrobiales bacterium]|nr:hypothetical protein [Verrucomicrobiales bacterium]